MASNRSDILNKTHKVLRKHFSPTTPNMRLPVLEQLVYGCCLEDASAEPAQQAFSALEEQFFDWNEVRVSTITELSEVMRMLPDPRGAAVRAKRVLQSVFEASYSFDLEHLKKENIGAAAKKLNKIDGASPFGVAFVTQAALGGHAIPVSCGGFQVLKVLGVVSDKEIKTGVVPGIERAIAKNKGIEFGSLLNQVGAQFQRSPHSPAVRKLLLSISPDAKDRFPKRGGAKGKPEPAETAKGKKDKKSAAGAKKVLETAKTRGKQTAAAKKTATKKDKTSPPKKVPSKKGTVKKVTVKKKKVAAGGGKKKSAAKAKKKVPKKKTINKRPGKRKPR